MKDKIWLFENELKDDVYYYFDTLRRDAQQRVARKKTEVDKGGYEDQSSFMLHGALGNSRMELAETESLVGKLYEKPYFAHVRMLVDGTREEDYFLSDCDVLDKVRVVSESQFLLPFKYDADIPYYASLFHTYQAKNGESFKSRDGSVNTPVIICDDDIDNRELLTATLLYTDGKTVSFDEQEIIDADELLAQRLQENRNNPALKNIIATLQRSQFDIIQKDVRSDFAVQGCPGSGKTQILLHRLFYLRDMLSEDGWKKVMLITPSALFRSYSADLVKRFGLTSIRNTSIAELYKAVLETYDENFKNRQYIFELTEEFLPDSYLSEVYSNETILKLNREIEKSISAYVNTACELLNKEVPLSIDHATVETLIKELQTAIGEIDQITINNPDEDPEHSKERHDELVGLLKQFSDEILKHENSLKEKTSELQTVERAMQAYEEAKEERTKWQLQRYDRIAMINRELENLELIGNEALEIDIPAKYANAIYMSTDIENGVLAKEDNEYLAFLDEYCEQAEQELLAVTNKKNAIRYVADHNRDIDHLNTTISEMRIKLTDWTAELEELEAKSFELEQRHGRAVEEVKELRRKMIRARFFLQRLETATFEKEIWDFLAPIKEKYGIQTVSSNGVEARGKRSRILYKSDLLFYIKIYEMLNGNKGLPDIHMLCIDEAQDLHKADYDVLRRLFPKARFNSFGDISQELHSACGIANWRTDTGADEVYELNKNYRNAAAIVEFCNNKFGSSMEGLGLIHEENIPVTIDSEDFETLRYAARRPGVVIIVKDTDAFKGLCRQLGADISEFEYIDTNVSEMMSSKTKCYSVYAAKGLEFSEVLVYSSNMTINQKVVACTRAMENLYYYE